MFLQLYLIVVDEAVIFSFQILGRFIYLTANLYRTSCCNLDILETSMLYPSNHLPQMNSDAYITALIIQ